MKSQILILAIACSLGVACGSAKKSQTASTTSNANSSAALGNAIAGNYEMLDDNTFKLTSVSTDDTYGYSEKNAIKVGSGSALGGPAAERKFLNALLGPNGQTISYVRRGSCCAVKSPNGFSGWAMLDIYEVKYSGLEKPITLYINMYDPGVLQAPKGFTFKQ
jgi:hypothetical protein